MRKCDCECDCKCCYVPCAAIENKRYRETRNALTICIMIFLSDMLAFIDCIGLFLE